mgnify:CR=1 FL=1
MVAEELEKIEKTIGKPAYAQGKFKRASELFEKIATERVFPEFLTLAAYDDLE